MEARDFDDWNEMNEWEKELETRIAEQVGELPEYLQQEIYLSEHGGEWALAARDLLRYAFVKDIKVDAELVKPAIAFWRDMFFSNSYSLLFAGRWLTSEQIEEIWNTNLMPIPTIWPNGEPIPAQRLVTALESCS
ncbi:MAG: hypothetical protein LBB58_03830 [Cellulomonadaceae bacterium]|jgi:hypothetical protein|nr:hypothetical protein [Cellulomonadaceae bacterium]